MIENKNIVKLFCFFVGLFLIIPSLSFAYVNVLEQKGTVRLENNSKHNFEIYIDDSYEGTLKSGDTEEYEVWSGDIVVRAEYGSRAVSKDFHLPVKGTVEWTIDWMELFDNSEDYNKPSWR